MPLQAQLVHLKQLIPFIHQEELSRIKREINQRPLSVIFYGTTHVSEAFVIVLCYLMDDWELMQCIGWLKLLAKSMMGKEIALQIIVVLSTELEIPPQSIASLPTFPPYLHYRLTFLIYITPLCTLLSYLPYLHCLLTYITS